SVCPFSFSVAVCGWPVMIQLVSGEPYLLSAQRRCPGGGMQDPGGVHPYLPIDKGLKLSLAKGVSMSLPSSPLLPRQTYVMAARPCKKSPDLHEEVLNSRTGGRNLTSAHTNMESISAGQVLMPQGKRSSSTG
ncbi:Protein TANC1, partial [Anabarilius grahami]